MSIIYDLEELAGPTGRLTKRIMNRKAKQKLIAGAVFRLCTKCQAWKTLESFPESLKKGGPTGPKMQRHSYCYPCLAEYAKKRNKVKAINRQSRQTKGVTNEQT